MTKPIINLLLADDDEDDCGFFREVIESLPIDRSLTTVTDGEALIKLLDSSENLPDVLFLDLNMPRRTGLECLTSIKQNERLANLPVVIYSTSLDKHVADVLYEKGANYYIQKPTEFSALKDVIQRALATLAKSDFKQPPKNNFILHA